MTVRTLAEVRSRWARLATPVCDCEGGTVHLDDCPAWQVEDGKTCQRPGSLGSHPVDLAAGATSCGCGMVTLVPGAVVVVDR